MANFFNYLQDVIGNTGKLVVDVLPRLMAALVILVIGFIIANLSRRAIYRSLSRNPRSNRISIGLAQVVFVAIIGVSIIVALGALGIDAGALIAGLGLTGLAIGFAMRDILENTTAGLLLSFTQPFSIGDWIRVGDVEGSVVDLTVHITRIRTANGTEIRLPNRTIYTSIIENKTAYAERRLSLEFTAPPEGDLVSLCEVGSHAAAEVPGVLNTPPVSSETFIDPSGKVRIRIYFWVDSHADAGLISTRVLETIQAVMQHVPTPTPSPAPALPPS
jgi:small-conductance mechanosensitive channel